MRIYKRDRITCFVLAFVFIQALLMLVNIAWGGGRIDNISLMKVGDYTQVSVCGDKPFELTHFIEEAKNGKPYRLVMDCHNMVFDLPQHKFREGLPPGIIHAIRTSQYQVTPEKIVRVVLDLKGTVVYKVKETGKENQATITILTTREPDFKQWMAVKENKRDSEDGRAKHADEVTTITQTVTLPELGTPIGVSPGGASEQTVSLPKQEVKSTKTQKAVGDVLSSNKTDAASTTPTRTSESQPQVFSSHQAEKVKQVSAPRTISYSSVPLGPYWKEKTSTEEKKIQKTDLVNTETPNATDTETDKKQMQAADLGNTLKRGIGAVLGTEGVSAHESDTLAPGGVMTIQNPLQADLGIVPSRKLISYHPETRRDPFLPLTEREDMRFGEAPLPRFENLKLVGIIRDSAGNQALLEDEIGFGYILKNGDRIKNGYVLSVEENKAVFQVEEYGGYKTMTLELNPEY